MDRRTFMGTLAAGAGAAAVEGAVRAHPAPSGRLRKIATEEAFVTAEVAAGFRAIARTNWPLLDMTVLRAVYTDPANARLGRLLDIGAGRLADMDANGVDMHILSLAAPGVQVFEPGYAAELVRDANDQLAAAVRAHPTRFAGLACLPPQNPKSAVAEMERAIGTLKLNGFIVNSHTDGEYLDQPKFWPLLEAAESLDAPIYLHPRAPSEAMAAAFRLGLPSNGNFEGSAWGYAVEAGTHALRMIWAGVFDRFPRLRIVLGHMGENIPYHLWRLDRMGDPAHNPNIKLTPSAYFARNFAITTSGVEHPPTLRYAVEVLGEDNVMWAIDYPFQQSASAAAFMDAAGLAPEVMRKVASRNAERIFRLPPG